jgi:hypothetical protein
MSITDFCSNIFKKELASVKKAPVIFITAVLFVAVPLGIGLYVVFNWQMWNVIQMQKDEIASYQKKQPLPLSSVDEETAHDVALFLQFTVEHVDPKEISQKNILYWRALYAPSAFLDIEQKQKASRVSTPPHYFVVMWFAMPVSYRQMFPKCVGAPSLQCVVHEANNRFAIISMTGDVTGATLELSVVH